MIAQVHGACYLCNVLRLCLRFGGESSYSLCLFLLSNFVSPVYQASPLSTLELGVQPV